MNEYLIAISAIIGVSVWVLIIAIIWSLAWKLVALWKAARKGSVAWFIILGILNTLGILEILYIFIFSKMNGKRTSRPKTKRKLKKKSKR